MVSPSITCESGLSVSSGFQYLSGVNLCTGPRASSSRIQCLDHRGTLAALLLQSGSRIRSSHQLATERDVRAESSLPDYTPSVRHLRHWVCSFTRHRSAYSVPILLRFVCSAGRKCCSSDYRGLLFPIYTGYTTVCLLYNTVCRIYTWVLYTLDYTVSSYLH
jgi:hypothetical protein